MSFVGKLFSKKKDEDYETVLSNLANEIQTRQSKLSDLRLRERRSSLWATLYTLAGWLAYVSVWYTQWLPWKVPVAVIPVVLGPFIILFIRRIVQVFYHRKGNAEEKTLRLLQKKRRDIVEDIKKKTNYYSTRNLIERYDESSPIASPSHPTRPAVPSLDPRQARAQPAPAQTPVRAPQIQTSISAASRPGPISAINSQLASSVSPHSFPSTPSRRQWYDKLADAILGDDSQAPNSTRYALICSKCFTHNGLVKESVWEDTQFRCMKCQHLNSAPSSKVNGSRHSLSPSPIPQKQSASRSPSPDASLANTSVADTSIDSPASSPLRERKNRGRSDADGDSSMMEVDS